MQDLRHYINIVDQLNEEVKWQKGLFDHLFLRDAMVQDENREWQTYPHLLEYDHVKFMIPLIPSMMERLETTQRMRAFHVLGVEKLPTLIDLQGQRSRQISVFTSDSAGISQDGIWGGKGIVAMLTGDVSVGASGDIMSVPDKKGQRLINVGSNAEFSGEINLDFFDDPDYEQFLNDLLEMRAPILRQLKLVIKPMKLSPVEQKNVSRNNNTNLFVDENSFTGEQKYTAIKAYIDGVEPILDRHKEIFQKIFYSWVKTQSSHWQEMSYDYDEMIMGNFVIEKLYVIDKISDWDPSEKLELGWHEDYFPEPGVFCAQPRKQCQAIDFPIEVVEFSNIRKILNREIKNKWKA